MKSYQQLFVQLSLALGLLREASCSLTIQQQAPSFAERIKGALFVSALGDALGAKIEFSTELQTLQKTYPTLDTVALKTLIDQGYSYDSLDGICNAAYTDDTVFARALLEVILLASLKNWDTNSVCAALTQSFYWWLKGNNDPLYSNRSHGPTNISALLCISTAYSAKFETAQQFWSDANYNKNNNQEEWWNRQTKMTPDEIVKSGGCGAVMRAWPIAFMYDDLNTVQELAKKQSLITHPYPAAVAASVALVTGMFHIIQGQDAATIVNAMITSAENYNDPTKKSNARIKSFQPNKEATAQHEIARWQKALIAGELTMSDMLRYVQYLWQNMHNAPAESSPEKILGYTNDKNTWHRSTEGTLLGWSGDEAVAASLYLYLLAEHRITSITNVTDRNKEIWSVFQWGAGRSGGDSDSIAAISGAMIGARYGFSIIPEADRNLLPQFESHNYFNRLTNWVVRAKESKSEIATTALCQEVQTHLAKFYTPTTPQCSKAAQATTATSPQTPHQSATSPETHMTSLPPLMGAVATTLAINGLCTWRTHPLNKYIALGGVVLGAYGLYWHHTELRHPIARP